MLLIALVVALLLVVAGGEDEPAKAETPFSAEDTALASRPLYAAARQRSYDVMLPAGWKPFSPSGGLQVTERFALESSVDTNLKLVLGRLEAKRDRTIEAAQDATLQAVASGTKPEVDREVTFPNKRTARLAIWEAAGARNVLYVFDLCDNRYALHAWGPKEAFSVIGARIDRTVQQIQPRCV
ncbi:hypothetical protein SK069_10865 [Patulibacter brassicae]|uniref:PsbP C-terminal domain-containing protein n=1 Tax=Patulibacter brassicae TaxID=1705717 RepID=A0ABU4VJS4_9ACTN|nr:hypothetical protein [Patulibacter brassicae]MDX8152096.1 hypothetical protein [Patulibacter brassicae]